ncbi:recombinase family protein [Arthrobacter sp. KNU40]|uniref:recombinase family protein n=1 Tax=Arthrobacter sp. KNU40 TaxID=3447965 RepID=UPI003F623A36
MDRQTRDCTDLADRLGGTIVATFTDNDISAYSGKHRPGYKSLLETMQSGEIDGVIAWHTDRLHRSMVELESYVLASEVHSVATHTVKAGVIDLSTPSGRLVARQLGAVARYEVEHAIERQKAAKLQAAKAGLPSGGNRAYGYEQNGMVIIEHEAAVVREAIDRYVAGDSWRTIALDLNQRGIRTAKGNLWTPINVHNVANRKRNISIRVHNKDEYPAQWPALVSLETWEELQLAIRRGQALYGRRTYARKHLLTGFVFCGLCGNRMTIVNAQQRDGSYSPAFNCRKKDVHGRPTGCGKVKRKQAPVESLVTECLLYRLDTPDLTELINHKDSSPKLKQLLHDQEAQTIRLTEILNLYSTGAMDLAEYQTAKTIAKGHLDSLNKQVDALTSKAILAGVPVGKTVEDTWNKADLEWKRHLLDTVIEGVYIYPKQPGDGKARYKQWIFNPDRVEIRWKS